MILRWIKWFWVPAKITYKPSQNPVAALLCFHIRHTVVCLNRTKQIKFESTLKLKVLFLLPCPLQACVDPSTKDELHMVEVEGQDAEGQKIKAALVSLKPSTLPSVSKLRLIFAYVHFSVCWVSLSLQTPTQVKGYRWNNATHHPHQHRKLIPFILLNAALCKLILITSTIFILWNSKPQERPSWCGVHLSTL